MAPKKWRKSYETGNALIDGQHREIIDCVEGMAALMNDGRGEQAYAECRKLRGMMERHVADEEKILRDAKFPRLDRHRKDHENVRGQLKEIFDNCGEACKKDPSSPCTQEISLTMFDHIIRGDLDFKSFLQMKNLASENGA